MMFDKNRSSRASKKWNHDEIQMQFCDFFSVLLFELWEIEIEMR